MKHHWLLLGVFACTPASGTDRIALEAGKGIHHTERADLASVRYLRDRYFQMLDVPGHYELFFAHWNRIDNNAVGVAIGIQPRWERFHADAGFGLAWLEDKTVLSGTHQQFMLRIGVGYTVGRLDYIVFLTHFSNAKSFFRWNGPNGGYDFVTLQVRYALE